MIPVLFLESWGARAHLQDSACKACSQPIEPLTQLSTIYSSQLFIQVLCLTEMVIHQFLFVSLLTLYGHINKKHCYGKQVIDNLKLVLGSFQNLQLVNYNKYRSSFLDKYNNKYLVMIQIDFKSNQTFSCQAQHLKLQKLLQFADSTYGLFMANLYATKMIYLSLER